MALPDPPVLVDKEDGLVQKQEAEERGGGSGGPQGLHTYSSGDWTREVPQLWDSMAGQALECHGLSASFFLGMASPPNTCRPRARP